MTGTHTLIPPETGTRADAQSETVLQTADGATIRPGDIVVFDRFQYPYRLQAFEDALNADACFADFHLVDPTWSETAFALGFDMAWRRLATVLDTGTATVLARRDEDPSEAIDALLADRDGGEPA